MARTWTIGALLERTDELADIENLSHIQADTKRRFLDQAYTELVDLLADCDINLFEAQVDIVIADDTGMVAVPSDHYKTLAIEYDLSDTLTIQLESVSFANRNKFKDVASVYRFNGYASGYRLAGNTIVLLPSPNVGQTYRHIYVPTPAILIPTVPDWTPSTAYLVNDYVINLGKRYRCVTAGTSAALPSIGPTALTASITDGTAQWAYFDPDAIVLDGIAGYEELLVVIAARHCLIKSGEDTREILALEGQLRDRIKQAASDRQQPQKIADTRGRRNRRWC